MEQLMIIDTKAVAKMKAMVKYANDNPLMLEDIQKILEGGIRIAEEMGVNDGGYKCLIDVGFCIILTIEDQPDGWLRHMQITYNSPDIPPSPEVVKILLPILEFKHDLDHCIVKVIPMTDGRQCVHIYEPV